PRCMTATVPRKWTADELAADIKRAIVDFRRERFGEPMALWMTHFREHRKAVREGFGALGLRSPSQVRSREIAAMYGRHQGGLLRYMAAPPIAHDDLQVLAESTLSGRALRKPYEARSVLRTIEQALDPFRFPWVAAGRRPSPAEWKSA